MADDTGSLMPISPRDLLDFASSLADSDLSAARRACSSRAYYAGFHAAHEIVEDIADNTGALGEHGKLKHGEVLKRLRTWSTKHPDRKLAMGFGVEALAVYNMLVRCMELRRQADYDLDKTGAISKQQARESVGKTERIIGFVQKVAKAATK